ncbi:MAG: tetratricopeptide repeat protein [Capsulimonadaceae bacterium]|nr:tetratricopeptide repeat protein [Capsulimonadaceae bacterium]
MIPLDGGETPPAPNSPASKPPPLAERLPDPEPPKRPAAHPRVTPTARAAATARPKATAEQVNQANKHVQQANLLRIRGELKQSLAELVKAMEANPYDPAPHLLSAEILRNVGRPDDAITMLERAIELSPDSASRSVAEAKLARLVVEQDEAGRFTTQGPVGETVPLTRGRLSIVIASVIVPGLGQLLAGHVVKAAVLFALWLVLALGSTGFVRQATAAHGLVTLSMVSAGGAALVWLASLIDALNEGRGD